jgi:hypothetical protein
MCVIRGKQVSNQKYVGRPIITQLIAPNKIYVLWQTVGGKQLSAIDEIITDGFRSLIRMRCDLLSLHNIYALSTEQQHIYL